MHTLLLRAVVPRVKSRIHLQTHGAVAVRGYHFDFLLPVKIAATRQAPAMIGPATQSFAH
jgi:hypothetical protein